MNLYEHLAGRMKLSDCLCISYDELAKWPAEEVEEAKQEGCLVQINDADGVICSQCPKHCWKDVEIRKKDGRSIGIFCCEDEDFAGLNIVELERLQQWQINTKRLSQLGYGKSKHIKKSQGRAMRRQDEVLQMRVVLLKHHKFAEETINFEPATQKELQVLTEWSQPKVHRVMKAIFGDNPMNTYKRRCKTKAITGFLKRSDHGSYTVEAIHEPPSE